MNKLWFFTIFLIPTILITSCSEDNEQLKSGRLTLHFEHLINGGQIQFDQMNYINAAGNHYEVNEIQWFISDITLVSISGEEFLLDEGGFAHYIDTDLPETWQWVLPDEIPTGDYKSIKITFGIKGKKNFPNTFPNTPESNMIWPYQLGGDNGGYHYMKLNGFWMNTLDQRSPFNFHVGVGQEYDNEGTIIGFVQNWFETELSNSSFTLAPGQVKELKMIMNVENWFKDPNLFDFNIYGSMIMNNQEAMGKISENGHDVFSVEIVGNESGDGSK